MYRGTVLWFNASVGYGFIKGLDDDKNEYFVHYSVIQSDGFKTLAEGQLVEFEVYETSKGREARGVRVV